jgi:hypothetical protein
MTVQSTFWTSACDVHWKAMASLATAYGQMTGGGQRPVRASADQRQMRSREAK